MIFSDASKFNQPFLPRGLINIQVFPPQWFDFFKKNIQFFNASGMNFGVQTDTEGLTAGL